MKEKDEILKIWEKTTSEELEALTDLHKKLFRFCDNYLYVKHAGLYVDWVAFPPKYKEAIITLLIVKISKGNVFAANEKLTRIEEETLNFHI